ncbi:MAG: hypothetical protein LBK96_02350 [Prevotellaceae bacterium]|nr:hypothetical protein [Prevotellaceae bacterium]
MLNDTDSVFGIDTNKITIIDSDGTETRFDRLKYKTKSAPYLRLFFDAKFDELINIFAESPSWIKSCFCQSK